MKLDMIKFDNDVEIIDADPSAGISKDFEVHEETFTMNMTPDSVEEFKEWYINQWEGADDKEDFQINIKDNVVEVTYIKE